MTSAKGGGVVLKLRIFADRGGGVQKGTEYADVILEQPLIYYQLQQVSFCYINKKHFITNKSYFHSITYKDQVFVWCKLEQFLPSIPPHSAGLGLNLLNINVFLEGAPAINYYKKDNISQRHILRVILEIYQLDEGKEGNWNI